MSKKARKPVMPPTSPNDDLVPPHMLPDVPTIKPGAGFGDDIKKAPAPKKKMAGGGSVGSASKRADGCAIKGKTRGKFV
jgi:hypothetical protein